MDEEQFEDLKKYLEEIDEKLATLIILQKRGLPKPNIGEEERKVLDLCDGKHTIDDMVKATGKTENNVKVILSHLRGKGLIRSVKTKNIIVYEEI